MTIPIKIQNCPITSYYSMLPLIHTFVLTVSISTYIIKLITILNHYFSYFKPNPEEDVPNLAGPEHLIRHSQDHPLPSDLVPPHVKVSHWTRVSQPCLLHGSSLKPCVTNHDASSEPAGLLLATNHPQEEEPDSSLSNSLKITIKQIFLESKF